MARNLQTSGTTETKSMRKRELCCFCLPGVLGQERFLHVLRGDLAQGFLPAEPWNDSGPVRAQA
eukprot:11221958-Lingulodinium_polyedra.AAC.1